MRSLDHATILSPSVSTVSARNAWHNGPLFVHKIRRKILEGGTSRKKKWVGVCGKLPETLTVFQTKIWDFPYPIWDLDQKFDSLFQTWSPGGRRVTSFYGTHTVVGVNIIREIDLSPITNDEEVANRSKKHTQFKTRVHKPYPFRPEWLKNHTL